ncbi:hypothetical protein ACWCXX_23410 [Streptomyces sp. NPDC001732]
MSVSPDGGSAAPAPPGAPASDSPSGPASPAKPPSSSTSSAPPSGTASGDASGDASGTASEDGPGKRPPRPEAQSPLAGREAGEGRLRPGRQFSPGEIAHADSLLDPPEEQPPATAPGPIPVATPEEISPTGPERLPQQALDTPTVSRVKRVSLGAGIALIGLGLGFLAFRMRSSN